MSTVQRKRKPLFLEGWDKLDEESLTNIKNNMKSPNNRKKITIYINNRFK